MDHVVELRNVDKAYGNVQALKAVSISVSRGAVFAIAGPNGSGKTTLLKAVLSLVRVDAGQVLLFNSTDLDGGRRRLGAVLPGTDFYADLSAQKNLELVAMVKGAPTEQIEWVLTTVGLWERRKDYAKNFSLGMKQRLLIASALLGNPELLILDEPTNGLDPSGIVGLRKLLTGLHEDGKTILIASHQLAEMERICTQVALMNRGSVVACDSMGEIRGAFQTLENAYLELVQPL
jgi:ABC-2 type transport system ATP-binding protein